MSGQRALIYSRIRENMLDPSETDVTRGARQQDVMNAVARSSRRSAPRTHAVLGQLVREAADDRPVGRAADAARLGQVPRLERGLGALQARRRPRRRRHGSPSEDNPATIAMFLGKSAPQPPTDPFGPGCVTGHVLQ